MACRMHPDTRDGYMRAHADVRPILESTITACGIRNVPGVRDEHDADQARLAADPETLRWCTLTDACQIGV